MKTIFSKIALVLFVLITLSACGGKTKPDLRIKEDVKSMGETLKKHISEEMLVHEIRLSFAHSASFHFEVDKAIVIYTERANKDSLKALDVDITTKKAKDNNRIKLDRYSKYQGVNFSQFDYDKLWNATEAAFAVLKKNQIVGIANPVLITFDDEGWARGRAVDGVTPERAEFNENDLSVGEIRLGLEEEVSVKKVRKSNEYTLNIHQFYIGMDGKIKQTTVKRETKRTSI